ncbi:maleate cis-trans isomerase family protein [Methylobacterium soli]|uniref:maleate cis-trans isomerase family protein n=1 Tax=Methylobacterium soli TaxID=553447 RepID=UPI0017823AD7|nr:aspartate/glutamate racemase family protein [Methylobacterium soli]GJE42310.1 Arylmalonate decarboxylase [Methylobacterium soli]
MAAPDALWDGDLTGARLRLGMLTPSSNTVLEPMMAALAADLPGASVHFSRFRVTEIALSEAALGQFSLAPMIEAAELLGHAKVDAIAWNGTSAAWLGFARDEALCAAIERATGIPSTTSVLAFRDLFRATGARRIGLVTPYTGDVQARIMANWEEAGFPCTAERHLALSDNFSFAEVDEERVAEMARAVAREGCDAVAIVCTNMRGTLVAPALEQEIGVPVYDSIAATMWGSLGLTGREAGTLAARGSLFAVPPPCRRER